MQVWCATGSSVTTTVIQAKTIAVNLNFTFSTPKCLKYINKGKYHNSQTQQYFMKFLKYISYKYGLHVSIHIESSSGPQGVDPYIQTLAGLWDPQRWEIWATCFDSYRVIFMPSRCRSIHTNVGWIVGSPTLGNMGYMFRLTSSHLQVLKGLKMTRCESKRVAHIVTNIF